MTVIAIPHSLREKLGETAAEALIEDAKTTFAVEIARLRTEIAQSKVEIIRWMFIFWIGQFASIVGVLSAILFAFFKR